MNLGHGRAGHFPDYSFATYKYMPAWGEYDVIEKDNPSDYYKAFSQMVYAMRYLRGEISSFDIDMYADDIIEKFRDEITAILEKRQINASADWKAFGERLSGRTIEDFDIEKYQMEYLKANKEAKDDTVLGRFFLAAMAQKSMVTNKIFKSGNLLAGFSIEYDFKHFRGMKDFRKLISYQSGGRDE